LKDNYEILKERQIWKAQTEDRIRNIDGNIYALTKKELDSIGIKDYEIVVSVSTISVETFLSENKYG
jgi:hypothetical protein